MCADAAEVLQKAAYLGQEHITQISAMFSIGCVIEFHVADNTTHLLFFGACVCVNMLERERVNSFTHTS